MSLKKLILLLFELICIGNITIKRSVAQFPPLISVKEINISGNTLFDAELKAFTTPLEGSEVKLEQILELIDKLTGYYTERGYANSGAFFPPQKIADGKINIKILEGSLINIKIEGLNKLSQDYIKARLPPINQLLNKHKLTNSLEKLQEDSLIKTIYGEIIQETVGKNVLLVTVEENNPITSQITLTDSYSPSIGNFGGNAKVSHQNLLGFGDRLSVDSSQTEGLSRIGGSYSFPFNKSDGRIKLAYNNANNELIEGAVKNFGIKADYESFKLDFLQPIIDNISESLILGFGIEHIDSETFVLQDLSFSFTDGLPDGQSKLTALRFSQEYNLKGDSSFLTANSQFNFGIDAFNATRTKQGIDGIFWSWNGNIHWLKAINDDKDLVFSTRLLAQLTTDTLLPVEQFTIGGLGKVRGYRPNIGVADNGIIGSLEIMIPIINGKNWGNIQIIPFIEGGNIWNNNRDTTASNTFLSSGLALNYQIDKAFQFTVNYAFPLVNLTGFGKTETEDNLSFSLQIYPLRF